MNVSPDWMSLRIFLTALEVGSIFKASEKLGIANSAAAKRVQLLEAEAGVQLLQKRARGVSPTAAGELYARRARSLIDLAGQLSADMRAFAAGGVGTVRLVASPSAFAGHNLPLSLAAFTQAHPGVLIDVRERTSLAILHELTDGKTDLGLITNPAAIPEGLKASNWRRDRLVAVLYLGHPLASKRAVTFADLLEYPMVETLEYSAVSMLLASVAEKTGRRIDYRYRVSSMDAARGIVSAQLAVGIMPEGIAAPHTTALSLKCVPLNELWAARQIRLVSYAIERLSPAARLLRDHLLAAKP